MDIQSDRVTTVFAQKFPGDYFHLQDPEEELNVAFPDPAGSSEGDGNVSCLIQAYMQSGFQGSSMPVNVARMQTLLILERGLARALAILEMFLV